MRYWFSTTELSKNLKYLILKSIEIISTFGGAIGFIHFIK